MIVTIFTENTAGIQAVISAQPRLDEVVTVSAEKPGKGIEVKDGRIRVPLEWSNDLPPYIFPENIAYTPENLLAVVYTFLFNFEEAYRLAEGEKDLAIEIDRFNCLMHGIPLSLPESTGDSFEEYRTLHNSAVISHYGETTSGSNPLPYYREALAGAPSPELYAYTLKHYLTLLMDSDELDEAEKYSCRLRGMGRAFSRSGGGATEPPVPGQA
ncbi:MAG: hypothetical protein LRY55_05955 [Leadbetterella sp.]|nr:hypothetical protein [Leadbetterella sp.]